MTYAHRVLVITPFFHPHIGGSQRYMEELAVHLVTKHPNVHIDVLAYNTTKSANRQLHRGLTVYRIPCIQVLKGQFVIPQPHALLTALFNLSQRHYDVVWTHTRFFDTTWWGWVFAKLIGAKSVVTDHVVGHPIHPNAAVRVIAHLIDRTIAKWTLGRYDVVTVTNKAAQVFLRDELCLQKETVLAYGGVDTRFFSPKTNLPRQLPYARRRFHKHDVVVTFAGRLIWSKGITYFLRAIRSVLKANRRVFVVIAGTGPLEEYVQRYIKHPKLQSRIFFLGKLTPAKMRDLLAITDIFVHPSHHTEGLPNVILEAAASGCFVIATDNAGTKEILARGKGGLLIPQQSTSALTNALLWVIEHPKERRRGAARSQAWVRSHFAWNKLAEACYQQLICLPGYAAAQVQGTLPAMAG